MARNWKVGEAVKVIRKGTDLESIMDIGKRFPLFAILAGQTNDAAQKMFDAIPEMISARQLESRLRGDAQEPSEDGEEAPTPKYNDEYDGMTTKELAALCKKRKIEIKETYLSSKPYMIKKLRADDEDGEDEEAPKSKKKVAEDPAPKSKKKAPVEEDEDDEDEEPAPKAKSKKKPVEEDEDEEEAPKAKSKKKAPVEEDDEDEEDEKPAPKSKSKKKSEDDDWDI